MPNPVLQHELSPLTGLLDATTPIIKELGAVPWSSTEQAIASWADQCTAAVQALASQPKPARLLACFKLSKRELAFLCMAVIPQIESAYSNTFAKLSARQQNAAATTDLLLTLVSSTHEQRSALLTRLTEEHPIYYWGLINNLPKEGELFAQVKAGLSLITYFSPEGNLPDAALLPAIAQPLLRLPADEAIPLANNSFYLIAGGDQERQQDLAYRIAQQADKKICMLNEDQLLLESDTAATLKQALVSLALHDQVLFWPGSAALLRQHPDWVILLQEWLALHQVTLVLGETSITALPEALATYNPSLIELAPLDASTKTMVWEQLAAQVLPPTNIDWAAMSKQHPDLPTPTILQALEKTTHICPQDETITAAWVNKGLEQSAPQNIDGVALKTPLNTSMHSLIVNAKTKTSLQKALTKFISTQGKKGEKDLVFEGPASAGQDLALQAVASALGKPLYQMADKGLAMASAGTIETIFAQAARVGAVLAFDPAAQYLPAPGNGESPAASPLLQAVSRYEGLLIYVTAGAGELNQALSRQCTAINFVPWQSTERMAYFKLLLQQHFAEMATDINLAALCKQVALGDTQIRTIVADAVAASPLPTQPGAKQIIPASVLQPILKHYQS